MSRRPRHYPAGCTKAHGLKAGLVQPWPMLALTAPAAALFTPYVGESMVGLTSTSRYPAMKIAALDLPDPQGDKAYVTMALSLYHQRGERVRSG